MLPTVLASVWLSAGLLVVPALGTLAAVRPHAHLADAGSQTRRLRLAVAATAVALLTLGASAVVGSGPLPATLAAVTLGAAVLVEARRSVTWAVRGAVAWALLVAGTGAFLGWLLHRLLVSSLPPWQSVVSAAAWVVLVLATLRLRAPAKAVVAARARARSTANAAAGLPQLRRQLWPLASLVTAGAVAVVGTSVGVETNATRPSAPQVRSGEDLTSASSAWRTASTRSTGTPTSSTAAPPPGAATTPPPVQATAPDATLVSRPRRVRGTERMRRVTATQETAEEPRRTGGDAAVVRPQGTAPAVAAPARSSTRAPGLASGSPGSAGSAGSAGAQARGSAHERPNSETARRRARAPQSEGEQSEGEQSEAEQSEAGQPGVERSSCPSGRASSDPRRPVQPRGTATADTQNGRTEFPRPVGQPTKVWGVMPPDAVPHGRGWDD